MEKRRLWDLKNRLLGAHLLCNALCDLLVADFLFRGFHSVREVAPEVRTTFADLWLDGGILLVLVMATVYYERPVRSVMNAIGQGEEPGAEHLALARRRLLNEPFFFVSLDFFVWFAAAALAAVTAPLRGGDLYTLHITFLAVFDTAPIVCVLVFFMSEHIVGQHVGPVLFPEGGVSRVKGARRIRIRTRLVGLFFAINLVPFLSVVQTLLVPRRHGIPDWDVAQLRQILLGNTAVFILLGAALTFFVAKNLTEPLASIVKALQAARRGRFDVRVALTHNDELGYTGDVVNEMMEGLGDREQMRRSLALAREVQQNLLPRAAPEVAGLELAGLCEMCDQTGGDYFDYLDLGENQWSSVGVVVGDVSEHGVPAAMVMMSARATIRHHTHHTVDPAELVRDLNGHLCEDLGDSGRFMTLFLLRLEPAARSMAWVRAGHDPALLYDPATGEFEELDAPGTALGVLPDCGVETRYREGLVPGQVVLVASDGLWEARNPAGKMFGKDAMRRILGENAARSAKEIAARLHEAARTHRGGGPPEDDVTIVVAKITE